MGGHVDSAPCVSTSLRSVPPETDPGNTTMGSVGSETVAEPVRNVWRQLVFPTPAMTLRTCKTTLYQVPQISPQSSLYLIIIAFPLRESCSLQQSECHSIPRDCDHCLAGLPNSAYPPLAPIPFLHHAGVQARVHNRHTHEVQRTRK